MERRGIRFGGRWALGMASVLAALSVLALAFADDPGESAAPAGPAAESSPPARSEGIGDLLNLDLDQLAAEPVVRGSRESNLAAPSSQLDAADLDGGEANTLGGLLTQSPSVSAARLSALNLDPRVRGYHSGQINASANGMTQLKTRVDLDSLFSQIDPGIVDQVTIIDGPYTSLYGPGFAFLAAELLPTPQFGEPQTHFATSFYYGTNGQNLYNRDNVLSSGRDWGVLLSYGIRASNDYTPGGGEPHVPSSYQKWDGLLALSYKVSESSRLEFQTLRTDINNLELPGVAYDIRSSVNDQYNLRYVVQEDPQGPRQLVLQSWWNQTHYRGDALNSGKQWTFIQPFYTHFDEEQTAANIVGEGHLCSLGVRGLRTFGERDDVQWTIGADWRRYEQRYQESDYSAAGDLIYGRVFGIPKSQMDDLGLLTDLSLPMSDRFSLSVGGRVDYTTTQLDSSDPVVAQWYASGLNEPNYTLGMAYASGKLKLDDEYALRAGTGYAMRPPNLTELYVSEPFVPVARFGSSYVDGLSTLRPEYDLQFDLGLSRKTERTAWALRGFYSLVWNYIEPVPAYIDPSVVGTGTRALGRDFRYFPPDYRTDLGTPGENADQNMAGYQYENLGLATLFGADFYIERKLNDRLAVFGTMAYVCGINETPMAFYQSEEWYSPTGTIIRYPGTDGLPGIYPLNGTAGVRLHAPEADRWMLEFVGRFVAPQDHVAVVLAETPSAGFAVFDLRGYYRLSQRMRLVMSLQNLLDKDYSEPGSLAIRDYAGRMIYLKEPGFNGVFGVEARF